MDITLSTERLLLRQFKETDLEAYALFCADKDVMQYIGSGETISRTQAWSQIASFLGHWQLRGYGMWAVENKLTNELVGRVGFLEPAGWPGFELCWLLGRDYWGNGFATEAASAALNYAFSELDRDHVISLMYPENIASIRVAKRLGEELEKEIVLFNSKILVYGIHQTG